MCFNVPLTERFSVIFLFFGKPRQPFGSGQKCLGKTVDNHGSLRVNTVCFISLDGGFVYTNAFSEFRHCETQFQSSFLHSFTDLFCGECNFFFQGFHLLANISITYRYAICNPILRIFSKIINNRLQNRLTRDSKISIITITELQNEYFTKGRNEYEYNQNGTHHRRSR